MYKELINYTTERCNNDRGMDNILALDLPSRFLMFITLGQKCMNNQKQLFTEILKEFLKDDNK